MTDKERFSFFNGNPLRAVLTPVLCLFLLIFSINAFGQGSFMAAVDRKKLPLNATFQITFTLSNGEGRNFSPPTFEDFSVLQGPNESTSIQVINGNMMRSVSISYRLKPLKEGTFTISPASIMVSGKTISSNSVTVEVTKADAKSQSQQGGSQDIWTQINESVLVRLFVDKREVYQGEQVTATYKLYNRAVIGNTSFSAAPSFTGFWSQELEVPEHSQTMEVYGGMQYNVSVVKKYALFPQRSGELEIPEMELETFVRVQVGGHGFFAQYQDYEYKFKSNSAKVKVKPLPSAGVPPSFNGAVGDYQMDVTLDKIEAKVDETVTLRIGITGTGNIKMLEVPKIELLSDLEAFDPKLSEKILNKNIVSGTKTYEYLIITRRAGEFKIPPVEFSFFDLDKRQYITQRSPEYVIKVTGTSSSSSVSPSTAGISKEDVELLGEDIRFIKTGETRLKKKNEFLFASGLFAGLYAAPFLLFVLLMVYKRREEKLSGNVALLKNRRANKEAALRLKKAKQYLTDHNRRAFFDEITRAIWGYLGDKLNISQAALSREQIQRTLAERNISAETTQRVFRILDDAEMALFSPVSDGEMDKAYKDANEIISKLEEEL